MYALIRREALLIVLAVALTGVAVAATRWARPREVPATDANTIGMLVEPMPEAARIYQRRIAAKDRVIARLAAGELTLLEAAAWFRYFNDNPPEMRYEFRHLVRGHSEGEKACRQVLTWIEPHLRQRMPASQAMTTMEQLEGELASLMCEKGEVELPW